MSRLLDRRLSALREEGKLAFMPFLVVGDPHPEGFFTLADALVRSGADALELGFPYSDPPADGPVIQAADARALAAGMTTTRAFELVGALRSRHEIPVSILVYYNLVLQHGLDAFYARAREAGIDAVLVADVPLELTAPLAEAAGRHGVAHVCLASAVTTAPRAARLAELCESYVYAAARVGVTGARAELEGPPLQGVVTRLRDAGVRLPILAGFGLSTPAHVEAVGAAGADGAIVGSAIVAAAAERFPDLDGAAAAIDALAAPLARAAHAPRGP